jgi:hypothetical protein
MLKNTVIGTSMFAACVLVLAGPASVARAQNVPVGRVLVVDGVSAALVPVNPPPTFQGLPNVPPQFLISGIMVSVSSLDASVSSFHTALRWRRRVALAWTLPATSRRTRAGPGSARSSSPAKILW